MSARTSFLELGEYKDSPQKAKEATEKCKEELYNEGVQEYTAGYFQSAYEYLKDISDYKDAASYLDKTNIMLSFSGVYRNELKKKENADYLVIKGWDLYQRGMHRSDIFEQYKVSLVEVNDETGYEYALVGEKYRDTPSLAPTIYYLVDEYDGKWIKDAVGLKAINPFYRGYGSYLEYIEDDEVTFDQLEAIYNKELNRKAPSVGMTEEQVRNRHLFQKITMPCTLVLIFLYILLMPRIGFTIDTFFFLTLQITLLSTVLSVKSWLKSALIALIASLAIFIIFGCAFGLAVPKVSFIDLGLGNLYRAIFG